MDEAGKREGPQAAQANLFPFKRRRAGRSKGRQVVDGRVPYDSCAHPLVIMTQEIPEGTEPMQGNAGTDRRQPLLAKPHRGFGHAFEASFHRILHELALLELLEGETGHIAGDAVA